MLHENVPSAKFDPGHAAQRPAEVETQRSSDISTFFIQAVAEKVGINPTDLKVLSILSRQSPLSAGCIAELTGLTTGAITFILDHVEKAGFARRVCHPIDRRVVLIELIPEPLQRATSNYFDSMS